MKVVIAGSRTINNMDLLRAAIAASSFTITTVISGAAKGVDRLGERWAKENKVPVSSKPARWRSKDGELNRNAGFERNEQMADEADALIALWDGHSKGTLHMMRCMGRRAKPIYYINTDF